MLPASSCPTSTTTSPLFNGAALQIQLLVLRELCSSLWLSLILGTFLSCFHPASLPSSGFSLLSLYPVLAPPGPWGLLLTSLIKAQGEPACLAPANPTSKLCWDFRFRSTSCFSLLSCFSPSLSHLVGCVSSQGGLLEMVSPKQLVCKRGSGSEHEFFHHITWL